MSFVTMRDNMWKHFDKMIQNVDYLFEVSVDKDRLWDLYLESFAPDDNKIFRERREHDCSCCRHFIKSFGNVVAIKDGIITSVWDFDPEDVVYEKPIAAMRDYIKSCAVSDVFYTRDNCIGTKRNYEMMTDGTTAMYTWEHFAIDIPNKFIYRGGLSKGEYQGDFRDTRNVFKRSLDEITEDAVSTVLELIAQKSLYRGEEWEQVIKQFLKYKISYDKLTPYGKEIFAWEYSAAAGKVIGRIRNHSIGTLLVNISEDMDLDTAVTKYEDIVAPTNYKRPKAIYTKKMLEEAKAKISELGYIDALARRYATMDDITVNNIIFSNKDATKRISGTSVFDDMESDIAVNPKKFSKVEEISIEDFITNVVPLSTEMELLFENRLSSNMVSLIAPQNSDSKSMFKWDNNFCWAYSGNIADSSMKERVKSAGGNVEGDLRFSIQWNDTNEWDKNDLDAHCVEPGGYEIYYSNKRMLSPNRGMLDVDIIDPISHEPAVENITYVDRSFMRNGIYRFFVKCFTNSGGRGGFRAEIEFDGQIYSFDYNKPLRTKECVEVATVTLKNGVFTIQECIDSSMSSRDIWGLKTNQFVPVTTMMYSPNYWDDQRGIGNKHYFFMLKDCVNTENPNGFYNEFLNPELNKHKRVMEALGSKLAVQSADDQLSGVGFSSTKRNHVIVKVKGKTERVLKVNF